ncbi:uncharacterized protein DUF4154 [Pseudomonas sp. SLBN-26]|uniref:YfiR family protein n=1 Tax=Pseudomonadaceae TaxID=135621 RepID=UPI00116F7723|nr:YfiR family protein [Pseudomonas sp. SLBN-26]MCP1618857.1 hypothetical protein [Pseudomonas otitidis]TQL08081.1 uncharacterized protein DUF4154 [Pseudomonas sp. SLBN-26]
MLSWNLHPWQLGLLLGLLALSATAQEPTPNPAEIRGERVRQAVEGILAYSRWPQPKDRIALCITGPTQYADRLLAGVSRDYEIPVSSRRLLQDSPDLETTCDALYIGILDLGSRQRLLGRLADKPVLTISESADACSDGSLFCLDIENTRVSFAVNLDAVARSGLRIHPQVLQLGRRNKAQP